MEEMKCIHAKKERSEEEFKDLIHRLNRIEGQVRGIKRMVEDEAYCPDILIQVSAVNSALNSFSKVLLGESYPYLCGPMISEMDRRRRSTSWSRFCRS